MPQSPPPRDATLRWRRGFTAFTESPRAPLGLLAALLVHGLVLLLFQFDRPDSQPVSRSLIELRLLAKPSAPRAPERPRQARPGERGPARPSTQVATPIATPALAMPPPSPAIDPTPTKASTTIAAMPAPLNLSLPPERPASGSRPASMLSQMLQDPRARSAKRTVEFAVADAAGTLPVTVQAATDGSSSKLIRQGSRCTRVTEARIKTLNPMDDNARGVPSVAGSCFRD